MLDKPGFQAGQAAPPSGCPAVSSAPLNRTLGYMQARTHSVAETGDPVAHKYRAWNTPASGRQQFLHTAVVVLAPSSSESDSGSSTSDADSDDSEEESEHWKQFRDVGDGSDDDDADDVDAKIPGERFVLSQDVRRKGAAALEGTDDPDEATGPGLSTDAPRLPADGVLQDKCAAN